MMEAECLERNELLSLSLLTTITFKREARALFTVKYFEVRNSA